MKKSKKTFWTMLGATLALLVVLAGVLYSAHPAYALPEYAQRTEQACTVCHVNPGGGGPRTLRGLLWAAQGKPDELPELANVLLAPNVEDGAELYDIACAACHGAQGEGVFGKRLLGEAVQESKISSTILRGRLRSGMPSFDGQFTDAQLEALVAFVSEISSGQVEFLPDSYELPPVEFSNGAHETNTTSGGN